MLHSFRATPHADVLLKVFDLAHREMGTALAERILELDFPDEEAARIEVLNAKANEGELTPEEQEELQVFANIADLLAYWQSKARQALNRHR